MVTSAEGGFVHVSPISCESRRPLEIEKGKPTTMWTYILERCGVLTTTLSGDRRR